MGLVPVSQYPKEDEGCEWKEFFASKAAKPSART